MLRRLFVLLILARIDGALVKATAARTKGLLAALDQSLTFLVTVHAEARSWTAAARSRLRERGARRMEPAAACGAVDRLGTRTQLEGRTSCLGRTSRSSAPRRREFEGPPTRTGLGRRPTVGLPRATTCSSGEGSYSTSSGEEWLLAPVAAVRRSLQSLPTAPYSQLKTIKSNRLAWNSLRATLALLGRRWRRWPRVGLLQLPMRPRPGLGTRADLAAKLTVVVS